MTSAEMAALAAAIVMIMLIEIQIIGIKRALKREIICRKSFQRITKAQIKRLWEDIRAAGIPRCSMPEENENDKS